MAIQIKIIFLLLILIPTLGESQLSWTRRNTAPIYELGDIMISPEGHYFVSLSQNAPVYVSTDEGDSWTDVSDKSKLYNAFSQNKYFKLIDNQVYYGKCYSLCSSYKYFNGKFIAKLGISENFENLFQDQKSKVYAINQNRIFFTDSNWMIDNSLKIWETKDKNIATGFFYQADTNYIVTTSKYDINNPANYITSIYILNAETKKVELYSEFKLYVGKELIQVSKSGNICILYPHVTRSKLKYADRTNSKLFHDIILDSQNPNINVYSLGSASDGTFYAVTNYGVYFNDGIDFSYWIKAHYMSQNFPTLDYSSIENKYFIKDSLTAIVNYGNNCGESKAYTFNQKYKKWKLVELGININNLDNIQKDLHGTLYAFSSCRNYPAREYYRISEDDGKTWELFIINGEYVRSVGVNKDKAAIALAGENLFLQNVNDRSWKLIKSPLPDSSYVSSLFFYSSNGILFFETNYLNSAGFNKIGFYFSKDGGLNWTEFSPFHQSSTDNYNDRNILVTKDRWIAYSYLSDPTVFSEDEGQSWQLDPMFGECDHITQMVLLPDNRLLISCQSKNEFGVFVSNSNNELELLSPYFRGKLNTVNFNSPSHIFGYYDLNSSPFFSKDLGKSVFELDQGITPIISDYRYFTSSLIDANNRVYLTIQNDGLYVTDTNVFTQTKEENKKENYSNIQLRQIGKNLQIDIFEEISEVNNYKYSIYNQLSQNVTHGFLNSNSTLININQLTSGVYYFQIVNLSGGIQTYKFIHTE